MNIIIVNRKHSISRTFALNSFAKKCLLVALLTIPVMLGVGSYFLSQHLMGDDLLDEQVVDVWFDDIQSQQDDLQRLRYEVNNELQGLRVRMAEMQSRLLRIDALGERLVNVADLESDEFNFSEVPAVGGPEDIVEEFALGDISKSVNALSERIDNRHEQIKVLDRLLFDAMRKKSIFVAGRPIRKGWLSSRYGTRTDPFTGKPAWHAGVDFAGKRGSDIISVAAGVVTWSGKRYGYGLMVEVSHGDGFKTRYAHCEETKVIVGDVVQKGEVIATMGSSGRSTGPHVHFEVYKDNKTVDPSKYIFRKFG